MHRLLRHNNGIAWIKAQLVKVKVGGKDRLARIAASDRPIRPQDKYLASIRFAGRPSGKMKNLAHRCAFAVKESMRAGNCAGHLDGFRMEGNHEPVTVLEVQIGQMPTPTHSTTARDNRSERYPIIYIDTFVVPRGVT